MQQWEYRPAAIRYTNFGKEKEKKLEKENPNEDE